MLTYIVNIALYAVALFVSLVLISSQHFFVNVVGFIILFFFVLGIIVFIFSLKER